MKENSLAVFEDYKIRRIYDEESETWYFSVVDIVKALIQQPYYQTARNYWKVLKKPLNKEGSEPVTKCNRLKMEAPVLSERTKKPALRDPLRKQIDLCNRKGYTISR